MSQRPVAGKSNSQKRSWSRRILVSLKTEACAVPSVRCHITSSRVCHCVCVCVCMHAHNEQLQSTPYHAEKMPARTTQQTATRGGPGPATSFQEKATAARR